MPTFKEITGYDLHEYVIISLPGQVHINDERRKIAIDTAIRRYTKLVEDSLPIGYRLEGETIICTNDNDPCPIGYPSKDGHLDWSRIIDELNFDLVILAYRKIR